MYCHVGVQITGKTGASTEESHEHHVGGDTAGNGSDSGSASRESPPPPPTLTPRREGGAASTGSDEQVQPQTRPRTESQDEIPGAPPHEWGPFSSL